ncbi:cell division ATP-binding protein FtsE [Calditrichota bacterium]
MVKLLNVSYRYQGTGGVENVTFEIGPNDFILLVGKTGAGKTTILKLISMELSPKSGEITLEHMKSSELKSRKLPEWRRRIGIVYQDFRLLGDRSVLENVKLTAACQPNLQGSPKLRAVRALGKVGITHKLHNIPGELSTGEQQRTALARALVNEPYVLLADEPVSNLDSETSSGIVELLQRANQMGTAMLIATHQPERFSSCNPRVLVIERGHLREQ